MSKAIVLINNKDLTEGAEATVVEGGLDTEEDVVVVTEEEEVAVEKVMKIQEVMMPEQVTMKKNRN